jgi:hypothetical protein
MYMQGMSGHITKPLYDQLSPQAKDNNAVTEIMPYYFAQRQVDDQFKVGKQIKDFVLPDTAGSPHTFLSLKGNDYVLYQTAIKM